ncbi:MAG TPA: ATP-binding protein [Chthoniobacterales bacterium]|nr:ATP-binding protein [Chthoniobacterales bacterium]
MARPDLDPLTQLSDDIVRLARLALTGRAQDVQMFVRRLARRYQATLPGLATPLTALMREVPSRESPLRRDHAAAIPVDVDSRFQLLRFEHTTELELEPIFRPSIQHALTHLVQERKHSARLDTAGLSATRSVLFTGPPGVGKTLAARWLASQLRKPLLTLDLSAVMSSYLGRTGSNVRHVLDYAKGADAILFLDEFDAVAKRRDDAAEIGELKRLVTVLLQEIDDWPPSGLLLAATNHPNLLDPAVWRRFEMVLDFPLPTKEEAAAAIRQWLPTVNETLILALGAAFAGRSFSDAEREIMFLRRTAAMRDEAIDEHVKALIASHMSNLRRSDRQDIAVQLVRSGITSQREARTLTGVSRDTIRKAGRAPAKPRPVLSNAR